MEVRPAAPATRPARLPSPGMETRPRPKNRARWILLKTGVWVLALIPLLLILRDVVTNNLPAEPIKDITHRTGWWALTLLLVTLAITPLRYVSGWKQVVKLRRVVGLFAFFYASIHFMTYLVLDQFFAFSYILEDIVERPFITVGFAAWVLLIPLAITSTSGWMRRLGRRWQTLHSLIYASAGLGALHFYWFVKADTREPLLFAGILALLLAFRLPFVRRRIARLH